MDYKEELRTRIVQKKNSLLSLSSEDLLDADGSTEKLSLGTRSGTLTTYVDPTGDGLRVMIHGALRRRLGEWQDVDGFRMDEHGKRVDLTQDELDAWW